MDTVFCSKCGYEYNRGKLKSCPRCKNPKQFYSVAELLQMKAEKKKESKEKQKK